MEDKHRGILHEGDIKLSHAQRRILGLQQSNGGRQTRAAMRSLARRWMDSNGRPVIPYRIEGTVGETLFVTFNFFDLEALICIFNTLG